MEVVKRYNWQTKRNNWSVIYGNGSSKTTAYFSKRIQAKLFIDWLIASDYSRISNAISNRAYWAYQDSLK